MGLSVAGRASDGGDRRMIVVDLWGKPIKPVFPEGIVTHALVWYIDVIKDGIIT